MKLIVFDVDGTLVDSQAHILAAMACAFEAAGLDCPSRGQVLSIVGLSLPQAMRRLAPDATPEGIEALVAGYRDSFVRLRAEVTAEAPLYPHARAVLQTLRARDDVVLGIATGKSRRGLRHLLEAHGFHGWFWTMQTADDHPSKPDPAMLDAAIADAGVTSAETLMIGDTTFDMEMAQAAGVPCVGVDWGYHAGDALVAAGADHVLTDFRDLPRHLANHWGMS